MLIRIFAILSLLLVLPFSILAQSDCPCCTEQHAEFNFWIGDWIVYDTSGNVIGENRIVQLEDKCIINENWTGSEGGTGRSFSYYNSTDNTWNQLWLDNKGSHLVLKGEAKEKKMVMSSALVKGEKLGLYKNRITWTLNEDGSVTQQWDYLDKNGDVLSVAFLGIYKKK